MPPTKRIAIKIGDGTKKRYLRFTSASLERLEEETGETPDRTAEKMSRFSVRSASSFLWAGLLHEEPELKRKEVLEMFPLDKYQETVKLIISAYTRAVGLPEPPEDEEEEGAGGGKEEPAASP